MIPYSLLESQAYVKLKPTGRALLLELLMQYNGSNNGDLSIPRSRLFKERGFSSSHTIKNSLEQLVEHGLIVVTKEAMRVGTAFQKTKLYALTWKPIDECQNQFGVSKHDYGSAPHPLNLWKKMDTTSIDMEKAKAEFKRDKADKLVKDLLSYQKTYGGN